MEMKEETLLQTSQLLEGLPTWSLSCCPHLPPLQHTGSLLLKDEAAFSLSSSPGPALAASPASQSVGPNRVGLCFTC